MEDGRQPFLLGGEVDVGVESREWNSAEDPVFKILASIDEGHQQGNQQVNQDQAPVFPYLDQQPKDLVLDVDPGKQEGNHQQQ